MRIAKRDASLKFEPGPFAKRVSDSDNRSTYTLTLSQLKFATLL